MIVFLAWYAWEASVPRCPDVRVWGRMSCRTPVTLKITAHSLQYRLARTRGRTNARTPCIGSVSAQ